MKKKRLAIILSSIAIVALVGGTYAAFTASTSTQHKVSTRNLKIELHQTEGTDNVAEKVGGFEEGGTTGSISYTGMPGDTVNEQIWIENTGSVDCFVRVTINRSWLADGEKIFDETNIDPKEIKISGEDNWYVMEDPDDSEVIYCYYKNAISSKEDTTKVMNEFSILKDSLQKNSNAYAGLSANIEFEADAIQALGAEDAMLAEWGVIANVDNGMITDMPQFQ